MARIASIKIDSSYLYNELITANLLIDILSKLPSDAIVKNLTNDFYYSYITIHSSSFKDIPLHANAQEIPITFKPSMTGHKILDKLDLNGILENSGMPLSASGNGFTAYSYGSTAIPASAAPSAICIHDFKWHYGLMEAFRYCSKCNKKELIP